MSTLITITLLAYLIGAIPSADLLARLRGRRIFDVGSGNMGAMNTARNLGYVWGALVLLMDIGKGALACLLGMWLSQLWGALGLWLVLGPYLAGVAAVSGHAWSVYVGFRGGKALAVSFGTTLVLFPVAGLITLGLLLVLLAVLRKVSLASALAAALLTPVLYLTGFGSSGVERIAALWAAALMAVIIIVKHWPDLQSLNQPSD